MSKYKYTAKQKAAIKEWEDHTGFEMMHKGSYPFREMWEFNNQWLRDWAAESEAIADNETLYDDRISTTS